MVGYIILIHFDNETSKGCDVYLNKEVGQKEVDRLKSLRSEIDFNHGVDYELTDINIIQ